MPLFYVRSWAVFKIFFCEKKKNEVITQVNSTKQKMRSHVAHVPKHIVHRWCGAVHAWCQAVDEGQRKRPSRSASEESPSHYLAVEVVPLGT